MHAWLKSSLFGIWMLALSVPAWGDTIVLINGDSITGKVVSLSGDTLELESPILGTLTLQRDKVASVTLGDRPVAAAQPLAAVPVLPNRTQPTAQNPATASPQEVVEQLQKYGIDPKTLGKVKEVIPLQQAPGAQSYFNDTLSGLMSGKLGVGDIRRDAVNARDQLLDLKKELGPNGAALDGYLAILENFIQKSEPKNKPQVVTPELPKREESDKADKE